jgi:hypothetical protein
LDFVEVEGVVCIGKKALVVVKEWDLFGGKMNRWKSMGLLEDLYAKFL